MKSLPAPREVRSSVRALPLRRTQGRSLCGAKDLGKAVSYREVRWGVVTGRMLLLRLLPHIVRQFVACPAEVGVVVAVGADLRFKAMPRYHNNIRRGRRPRRPLFGLPLTFASTRCTPHDVGAVRCARLSPRFARRDTRGVAHRNSTGNTRTHAKKIVETTAECGGQSAATCGNGTHLLAAPHSAGAVRQTTVKSGWHPQAVRGKLQPYPNRQRRDRLRPCVRCSASVRRCHRNTSRGKAHSPLSPPQFPYKKDCFF
jgi:hypothetical protein